MADDTATIDPNQQLAAAQAQALDPANAPESASNSQPLSSLIPAPSASDILASVQGQAARAGSGDQQAPIQSSGLVPSQPLTGTVPEPPMSPGTWRHMEWLHSALNHVADALAPGEVAKVVPQADGTYTVEKGQPTTKEKWGMIAARALGGAAQGLANSQGPGGLAKAAAAGTQYGLQQGQQQQQEAEQTADFKNKQMLAAANLQHIKQQVYLMGQQGKMADLQYDAAAQEMMKNQLKELTDTAGGQEIGEIDTSDPKSLTNLSAQVPGLAKLIAGSGDQEAIPVPIGNHKYKVVLQTKDWLDRLVDAGKPLYALRPDANGEWGFQQVGTTVKGSRTTNRDYETNWLSQFKDGSVALKNLADAQKATADKPEKIPTTAEQATAMAEEARSKGDTAGYTKYSNMAKSINQTKLAGERPPAGPTLYTTDPNTGKVTPVKAQVGKPLPPNTMTAAGMNALSVQNAPLQPPPPGTPVNYEPGFAPAYMFPHNTPGINPKQIGKVPADYSKAGRLGQSVVSNGQEIINILHDHPDLVGRLKGLGSQFENYVGISDNDPLAALIADVDQLSIANLGAHSVRSSDLVQKQEEQATNNFKNDPSSIEAFVRARMRSNQQFVDEAKRYRLYGDPDGPDQKLAAKSGTSAPTTTTTKPGGGVNWNQFPAAQ